MRRDGFTLERQKGSHQHYRHPDGRRVTVPFHRRSDTFPPKTLKSIIEMQAKWRVADFWDSHDLTDYSDLMREVEFDVQITREPQWIELNAEVAKKVYEVAKQKRIPVQILVNEWLREKLSVPLF